VSRKFPAVAARGARLAFVARSCPLERVSSERRTFLERSLAGVRPKVRADVTPPARALTDGLWVVQRMIQVPPRIDIPATTTVIRLCDGTLLVHSPFRLDPALRRELGALGTVAHLVAPNAFHYLYLGEHHAAFPAAAIHLAPGLRERQPSVPAGTTLGEVPPASWQGEIELAVLGPTRGVAEVAFLHRPSATLVLTDLAFNMQTATNAIGRLYWRFSGVWQRFGPTRLVGRVLLRDPALVRPFLARILGWDFTRIVVSHGDVVERDARRVFEEAFAKYR